MEGKKPTEERRSETRYTVPIESVNAFTKLRQLIKNSQKQINNLIEHNINLKKALSTHARKEARLHQLAYRDELTGLPNRNFLEDRIREVISPTHPQNKSLALILLDLDGLKQINDILGHDGGDKFLKAVAERLAKNRIAANNAFRYGMDEFAVILYDINGLKAATALAEEMTACLNEPYFIDGNKIVTPIKVGVAVYPNDGCTLLDLVKTADTAMYRVKDSTEKTSVVAERNFWPNH